MDLKQIIKSRNMKLVDVAKAWTLYKKDDNGVRTPIKTGVNIQNIIQICNSDNLGYDNLKQLSQILNMSVAELVAMMEDKNYTSIVCPKCGAKLNITISEDT